MPASVLDPRSPERSRRPIAHYRLSAGGRYEERDLHCQRFAEVPAVGSKVKERKRLHASTSLSKLFARLHQAGFAGRVQRTSAEHHLCLSF